MKCRICDKEVIQIYIKGICKDCWDNTPSTFNKDDINSIPKKLYTLTCKENHIYFTNTSNTSCPICYSIDIFCKECGKMLIYKISKDDDKSLNRFCSMKCVNSFIVKQNTKAGECTKCGEFSESRDAVGACLKCSNKQLELRKEAGECTICGVENKTRDQNGRGKDQQTLEKDCNLSGCNCSYKWFLDHNNKENMLEWSSKLGKEVGIKNFQKANKAKIKKSKILISKRKIEIENRNKKIEILKDKYNYPYKHVNYQHLLSGARSSGFKSNDPFKDIENFLIKVEMINKDIEKHKLERLAYYEEIKNKYTINDSNLDISNKSELRERYLNNPGVLFIWGYDKNNNYFCLTGGQTVDLYRHILFFLRYSDKNKVKECKEDNRWYEIANNYTRFDIKIINEGNYSLKDREAIEANYALENGSLYWKPSVTQIPYINAKKNLK